MRVCDARVLVSNIYIYIYMQDIYVCTRVGERSRAEVVLYHVFEHRTKRLSANIYAKSTKSYKKRPPIHVCNAFLFPACSLKPLRGAGTEVA